MSEPTTDDFDPAEWGDEPSEDAPPGTTWEGEWRRTLIWTYDGKSERSSLAWHREALQLDGHEDCCHHTWPIVIEVRRVA